LKNARLARSVVGNLAIGARFSRFEGGGSRPTADMHEPGISSAKLPGSIMVWPLPERRRRGTPVLL
jgi:hypothetical protein